MYAVIGQPPALLSTSFSPVTLGIVRSLSDPLSEYVASSLIGIHSHDPPQFLTSAALNLRI